MGIPITLKFTSVTFDTETGLPIIQATVEGINLQSITDQSINGEGCNITNNSIISKDADIQLRGSALMFKNSEGSGPIQTVAYPTGEDVPGESCHFTLDHNNGGTIAAS